MYTLSRHIEAHNAPNYETLFDQNWIERAGEHIRGHDKPGGSRWTSYRKYRRSAEIITKG